MIEPRRTERTDIEGGTRGFGDTLALHRPLWFADAACREHPQLEFVPEREGSTEAKAAKAVCQACLVRAECLSMAMRDGSLVGVWGGLTTAQRRAAGATTVKVRELKPIRHGTEPGYQQHHRRGEPACEACLEAKRTGRAG